jgi:1,4-dihydroxy-2-naphthoate octaprenyltransferase
MTPGSTRGKTMATPQQWWQGARPRTLPAAVAPVAAGTGVAAYYASADAVLATLALVVALAFQVGVNYANDYSDGVRGTDAQRIGPMRLTAAGVAAPVAVKRAALTCFAVGTLAGMVIVALTAEWWLLGVGAACMVAAWYYTGGRSPYGYRGLGEVSVFVFFGLVATMGTTYIQTETWTWLELLVASGVGALACALLVKYGSKTRGAISSGTPGPRSVIVTFT